MTRYIEVPLLPKSPTTAAKNRMQKINLYVWDNPGCLFSDIYKNSKATKNRNDLKEDISYLVSTRDLIYIESTKKFFREPIKKDSKMLFSICQVSDEIAKMDKNSSLQNSKLFKQIKKMSPRANLSNVGKIIDVYEFGIDLKRNINDQLLSKTLIIFFQKTRIFSSEIKGTERKRKAMHSRLHDFHKTQIELLEEQRSLLTENTSKRKNSIQSRRDLVKERMLRYVTHGIDWKRYTQSSDRIDLSLKTLDALVDFLQLFVKDYDFYSKMFSSNHIIAKELSDNFDQIFHYDKLYNPTLKSTTRRSLKELIQIQNSLFLECNEEKLAIHHGYKNKTSMLDVLEAIQNDSGELDFVEICRLQRMERNRILVPETTDDEILSLFENYMLHKGITDMEFLDEKEKIKNIIYKNRPYSPTI